MEENNIIICENCYSENASTRTTCKECGAKLYKNDIENFNNEKFNNENPNKKREVAQNTKKKEEIQYTDSSNSSNTVANKFTLVVTIIKVIGYLGAFITAIMIMSIGQVGIGFLSGIVIAIITWFSTLIFEAIAEALNLLQDIKNKL